MQIRSEYGHLGTVYSSHDIVRYEDLNTLWLPVDTISGKPVKILKRRKVTQRQKPHRNKPQAYHYK